MIVTMHLILRLYDCALQNCDECAWRRLLKVLEQNSMSRDIIVNGGSKMERKPSSVVNDQRFTVIVFYR